MGACSALGFALAGLAGLGFLAFLDLISQNPAGTARGVAALSIIKRVGVNFEGCVEERIADGWFAKKRASSRSGSELHNSSPRRPLYWS